VATLRSMVAGRVYPKSTVCWDAAAAGHESWLPRNSETRSCTSTQWVFSKSGRILQWRKKRRIKYEYYFGSKETRTHLVLCMRFCDVGGSYRTALASAIDD